MAKAPEFKLPREQTADGGVIKDRVTSNQVDQLRRAFNDVLKYLGAKPWVEPNTPTAGASGTGGGVPTAARPPSSTKKTGTLPRQAVRWTLAEVRGVDLNALGTVPLFTSNFTGRLLRGSIYVESADAGATAPVVSVGTNDPNYDDIFSSATLVGMTSIQDLWIFNARSKVKRIKPKVQIFMNVTTASAQPMSCSLEFEGVLEQ